MIEDHTTAVPLIWTNPGAAKGRPTLVRLTPDTLTLAFCAKADVEHVATELEDGGDVAGQVIPLDSFWGATGESDSAGLTVRYRTGPSQVQSQAIAFADKAARDQFADALAGALGAGWGRREEPVTRWCAGFWTLGPTLLLALLTWGLHAEAGRIARGQPPINWGRNGKLKLLAHVAHWVELHLGPAGVLIAGGALVLVGLLLFTLVMAQPPRNVVVGPVDPP
jgi:hypothetical protein